MSSRSCPLLYSGTTTDVSLLADAEHRGDQVSPAALAGDVVEPEVEPYAGRVDAARERLQKDERRLARSHLLRIHIQYVRAISRHPQRDSGAVLSVVRSLEQEESPWTAVAVISNRAFKYAVETLPSPACA